MTRAEFIDNVEACQEPLRRFVAALCVGDLHLADDIAQEALVKAYLAKDTFRGRGGFKTWVFSIAHNTYLDFCRRRRPTVEIGAVEGVSGSGMADSAFRYQELYAALAQLSDKERAAVSLYYIEGYKIEDIAGITGSRVDAVKQQLSRGRAHLREILTVNGRRKSEL